MRQLIDLLNTFAGSAARLPSGLSAPPHAGPAAPLPPPMSPAAAAAHPSLAAAEAALAAKLADGGAGCFVDYIRLVELNDQLEEEGSFTAAKAHRDCNRYSDVLPYDNNRVLLGQPHLSSSSTAAADGGAAAAGVAGGYINASPLRGGEGDVTWYYLASQGPLRQTREAFWQMVVEHGCSAVVMLTNTSERGVAKCYRYFPEAPRTAKQMGRYQVSTRAADQLLPDLIRRTLTVKDASQPQQAQQAQQQQAPAVRAPRRTSLGNAGGDDSIAASGTMASGTAATAAATPTVLHYQYASWPDHGVPLSPEPLLALCGELRRHGAHAAPVVVHCSAGIGRSGVFCVLDIITRRLLRLLGSHDVAAAAAAVDVAALVSELRRQRLGMVQTREQYVFCHTALLHFVRRLAAQQVEELDQQQAAAAAPVDAPTEQ